MPPCLRVCANAGWRVRAGVGGCGVWGAVAASVDCTVGCPRGEVLSLPLPVLHRPCTTRWLETTCSVIAVAASSDGPHVQPHGPQRVAPRH